MTIVTTLYQIDMLTQIDLGETSLSQQPNQAIVAQVLSDAIFRRSLSSF